MNKINDSLWLEYNLFPEKGRLESGLPIPDLPPEDIQLKFTGRSGRQNLEQAFAFYKIVLENCQVSSSSQILDFGAGWGRVSRFWLREVPINQVWSVDPYSTAVHWMRETNLRTNTLQINPRPPIPELFSSQFDVIYAYSVFSHLSEDYFLRWDESLRSLLKPDGRLVYTTRGLQYIRFIQQKNWKQRAFGDYERLLNAYKNGKFLFYKDRDSSNELSGDWYGEAFIPEGYARDLYGSSLVKFIDSPKGVDQSVIIVGSDK